MVCTEEISDTKLRNSLEAVYGAANSTHYNHDYWGNQLEQTSKDQLGVSVGHMYRN